jgi:hypothetical protein
MASIRWSYGVVFFDAQRVKPLRATASPSGVQYPLPNLELDLNLSGTAAARAIGRASGSAN